MFIVDGVDLTNPVQKPVLVSGLSGEQPKDNGSKKPVEVANVDKPVNLIDCGVLHFPTPE